MTQDPTTEDFLKEIKLSLQLPHLTETIRINKIIAEAAEEKGIKPDAVALQEAADQIRVNHNLKSAAETYAWLEKYDLSIDDFEELALRDCLRHQLAEHLFADKIEPYFVQHKLDYISAVIYEVVFDDEDLAMESYYALQAGEVTFPQVAHRFIQDEELRRVGGYLGPKRRAELNIDISVAVFSAKAPEILKPIMTTQGLSLILVEEVIVPTFDNQLRHKILLFFLDEWLQRYRGFPTENI
jgi:parvulin-like peptidyl-prolyl isomerase